MSKAYIVMREIMMFIPPGDRPKGSITNILHKPSNKEKYRYVMACTDLSNNYRKVVAYTLNLRTALDTVVL